MSDPKEKILDQKLQRQEKHDRKLKIEQEREQEDMYLDLPADILHKLYR